MESETDAERKVRSAGLVVDDVTAFHALRPADCRDRLITEGQIRVSMALAMMTQKDESDDLLSSQEERRLKWTLY